MASGRKRGKTWMGLYRDADGCQKSAGSFPTEKAALKAARLAEAGVPVIKSETVYNAKVRGKATVASYAYEWLPNHPLSAHARYVYEQVVRVHIVPALGMLVLANAGASDIKAYFRTLEAKGTSKALLAKIETVMSAMFQAAAEDGKIPFNPVRGVRFHADPPKRRRALTASEWMKVRRYLTGEYRLFCDIQVSCGARIEEIRGLEADDIEGDVWHVARTRAEVNGEFITQKRAKTGRGRDIMMDPEIVEQIKAMGPGRIFTDFRSDSFRQLVWYPACRAAQLDWKPAPRDLRRSFATWAREGGADLETVRVALGHAHLATTDIYLAERPGVGTEALEAVRKALKGAA